MNQKKIKRRLFPLLLFFIVFFPLLSFGQAEKARFLDKWSIGGGYNFLHRSKNPFDKGTIELSVKYRLTNRHSFYLTFPLYFENHKREQGDFQLVVFDDPWLYRIWGTALGYNYTVFGRKGLSVFIGIGFDFKRDYSQYKDYHYVDDNQGNKKEDHDLREYQNNAYGVSPQAGLSYRYGHLGCDLKYTFSAMLDMYKDDIIYSNGDRYIADLNPRFDKYIKSYRSLHGLSLSLFYYF